MALDGTQGNQALAYGGGLYLSLLKDARPSPLGTTVVLNPTYAAMGVGDPSTHSVSGNAYGSKVAGRRRHSWLTSTPTRPRRCTSSAAAMARSRSSIAAMNLSPALHVGAITDTARGRE